MKYKIKILELYFDINKAYLISKNAYLISKNFKA